MNFLTWLFEYKIVEMIASGLVGWIVTKILDPQKESSNNITFIANDLTIKQVNNYVQQQIYSPTPGRAPSSASDDGAQMFFLVAAALTIGVFVTMVAYGTLVVQIVRLLVAAIGFAAALLGMRIIFGSTAFQRSSWIIRVVLVIAVCVLLWFSLNYAEDGITLSIIRAQEQGRAINNLWDMIDLFRFEGVERLGYLASAILLAVVVSLMALTAQLHMLLSAYAATAFNPQDRRVRLLGCMGNRSSVSHFSGMVMLSLMAFALASGLWQRLLKMLFS